MINIITTPSILTDNMFVKYGGDITVSNGDVRLAAYAIAEGQLAEEIGTFLQPTIVTGTHTWPPQGQPLKLQYDRVQGILGVVAIHEAGCNCADDSVEIDGCAWLLNAEGGIVDVRQCGNTIKWACNCASGYGGRPQYLRIVYRAGLPTGTASDPRLQLALATVADLALQQIMDPTGAEGGPGDPGVQSYSSAGYSEQRTPLRLTAFGSSARANYAANLVKHFKNKSPMKLGW